MQQYFTLTNKYEVNDWKSIGLSNQYLNPSGTIGDITLSEAIKPMHVTFNNGGIFVQKKKILYQVVQ